MKRNIHSLGTVALVAVVMSGCNNSIKVTEMPANSIDSCYTQSEIGSDLSGMVTPFTDSVLSVWESASHNGLSPQQMKNERACWEKYRQAAYNTFDQLYLGVLFGSMVGMGLQELNDDLTFQFLNSFTKSPSRHALVSDQMVLAEYDGLLASTKEECDPEDSHTFEVKRKAVMAEREAWVNWLSFRASVSESLTGNEKSTYDACTNELRRAKLIQLKNRYLYDGVIDDDRLYDLFLSRNCTDTKLRNYSNVYRVRDSIYGRY